MPRTLTEAAGPVFGHEMLWPLDSDLIQNFAALGEKLIGQTIIVDGRVRDQTGRVLPGVLLVVLQDNAGERNRHTSDSCLVPLDLNFGVFGRIITDADGEYSFRTVKPGVHPWPKGLKSWRLSHVRSSLFRSGFVDRYLETIQPSSVPCPGVDLIALHILVSTARGINIGLQTRMSFVDDTARIATDPLLQRIGEKRLIETMIAAQETLGLRRFNIHCERLKKRSFSMSDPCILCVAITGSVPTKADNPAVPISIEEQIESTHEAFEAGASICHAHVRNDDQTPSSDPEKFARLKEGLHRHCPGMIIQFSTGGRSGAGQARGGMLPLRPDMASLSVGSNNFPTRVYENPPDLIAWLAAEMLRHEVTPEIEAFDMSHILQAIRLHEAGQLHGGLYVQFVMGVKNAMPADKEVFDFYVKTVNSRAPRANWCAAGIGAAQIEVNEWAIAAGGHTRAGLEDNVRLDRHRLAPSNAALIRRAAKLCEKYERPVATCQQAREILNLKPASI